MRFFTRAFALALLSFLLLFGLRLAFVFTQPERGADTPRQTTWEDFELSKKNYASSKMKIMESTFQPQLLDNTEKYEKVASVGQTTRVFDDDSKRLFALIEGQRGVVQYESARGLPGRRSLLLGVGVPPDAFDGFIAEAQTIGRLTYLSIVKNDKTNEYKVLSAKRIALEKARAAVEALRALDASVSERLLLEERFNRIEEEIQQLGVSLGEFDSQNEFYTVKLSLQEVAAPLSTSRRVKVMDAFIWSTQYFALLSASLLALTAALWFGLMAFKGVFRMAKRMSES